MKKLLITCLIVLLCVTPDFAKELTSEVTDKTIVNTHNSCYCIHTKDFGDIQVSERDYQKVMIGDNITFNTESFYGLYNVLKINNEELNYEL